MNWNNFLGESKHFLTELQQCQYPCHVCPENYIFLFSQTALNIFQPVLVIEATQKEEVICILCNFHDRILHKHEIISYKHASFWTFKKIKIRDWAHCASTQQYPPLFPLCSFRFPPKPYRFWRFQSVSQIPLFVGLFALLKRAAPIPLSFSFSFISVVLLPSSSSCFSTPADFEASDLSPPAPNRRLNRHACTLSLSLQPRSLSLFYRRRILTSLLPSFPSFSFFSSCRISFKFPPLLFPAVCLRVRILYVWLFSSVLCKSICISAKQDDAKILYTCFLDKVSDVSLRLLFTYRNFWFVFGVFCLFFWPSSVPFSPRPCLLRSLPLNGRSSGRAHLETHSTSTISVPFNHKRLYRNQNINSLSQICANYGPFSS